MTEQLDQDTFEIIEHLQHTPVDTDEYRCESDTALWRKQGELFASIIPHDGSSRHRILVVYPINLNSRDILRDIRFVQENRYSEIATVVDYR